MAAKILLTMDGKQTELLAKEISLTVVPQDSHSLEPFGIDITRDPEGDDDDLRLQVSTLAPDNLKRQINKTKPLDMDTFLEHHDLSDEPVDDEWDEEEESGLDDDEDYEEPDDEDEDEDDDEDEEPDPNPEGDE